MLGSFVTAVLSVLLAATAHSQVRTSDSIAAAIQQNLKPGDPATKIIETLGLPDKIKPYLDMTEYYYGPHEIDCYNNDFMKGEINTGPTMTTLSRIERQEIAWIKFAGGTKSPDLEASRSNPPSFKPTTPEQISIRDALSKRFGTVRFAKPRLSGNWASTSIWPPKKDYEGADVILKKSHNRWTIIAIGTDLTGDFLGHKFGIPDRVLRGWGFLK